MTKKIHKLFQHTIPPFQISIVYTVVTLSFQLNKHFIKHVFGYTMRSEVCVLFHKYSRWSLHNILLTRGESMQRLDYAEFVGVFYVLLV